MTVDPSVGPNQYMIQRVMESPRMPPGAEASTRIEKFKRSALSRDVGEELARGGKRRRRGRDIRVIGTAQGFGQRKGRRTLHRDGGQKRTGVVAVRLSKGANTKPNARKLAKLAARRLFSDLRHSPRPGAPHGARAGQSIVQETGWLDRCKPFADPDR